MPFLPLAEEFQEEASSFVRDFYEYSRKIVPNINSPEFMQFATAQNQFSVAFLRDYGKTVKFRIMSMPTAGYDISSNTIILPVWYYSKRALLKYTGVSELFDPESLSIILSNGSAFHESLHAVWTRTSMEELYRAIVEEVESRDEGVFLLKQIRPVILHVQNLLEDIFIEAKRDDKFKEARAFLVMKNAILFNDAELQDSADRFEKTGNFIDLVSTLSHFKNEYQRATLLDMYRADKDVRALLQILAEILRYAERTSVPLRDGEIDWRKVKLFGDFMYALASFAQLSEDEATKEPKGESSKPDDDTEDFEKRMPPPEYSKPDESDDDEEEPGDDDEEVLKEEEEAETESDKPTDEEERKAASTSEKGKGKKSDSHSEEHYDGAKSEDSAEAGELLEAEESEPAEKEEKPELKPLDAELEADPELTEELKDIEAEIDELIKLIAHLDELEEKGFFQKISDAYSSFKTVKVMDVMRVPVSEPPTKLEETHTSYSFMSIVRQMRNVNHTIGEARRFGGKLIGQRLNRIVIDSKIFGQKTVVKETLGNPQIILLVDWSGSMGSHAFEVLAEAKAIYEALRELNIPSAVYAHTGAIKSDGCYEGFPGLFHVSSYRMHSTDSDINNRFSRLTQIPLSHNYDGLIISWLVDNGFLENGSKSKMLIVLSDGIPAGSGYSGPQALQHTVKTIKRGRSLGIHILAFSLVPSVLVNNAGIYGREFHIDATKSVRASFENVFKHIQKTGFK